MSDLTVALEGKELEEYLIKRFGKKEHEKYMNQLRLNRGKEMKTSELQNVRHGIVDTLTRFRFVDEFKKIRPDNFSHEGLHALFDYFEELSYDIGQPIEFDPIAICCDFREYESFKQLQEDYDNIIDFEDLHDHTQVIRLEGSDGFIIQQF